MSHRYLVAAMAAALAASPLSAQSVKAGIDAWQRADYASAVKIWGPLASAGDANAQFNLGQAYRLGRGVQLDLNAAESWFERAADSGHVDAQTTLGLLYYQNGEREQGLKWLKRAADQGEARALLVYGTALFNGDGVSQDRVMGYAYVSRAASEGLAPAQETLDQLDQLLPLADRQKGEAIARSIPTGSPVASRVREAEAVPSPPPGKERKVETAPPKAPVMPGKREPAPPRKPVKEIKVSGGGWTIQLGAFSNRASAEALYRRLSPALNGMQPHYVAVGSMTKLRVGSFSTRAQATAACQSLKGAACFPFPEK